MAYFSLHAYDADVWIREFLGLNQSDNSLNGDVRFASEAENVETPDGVLQPQAALTAMTGSFQNRIETLAAFHRRWYAGSGGKDWMVICVAGLIYVKQIDGPDDWYQVPMPANISAFTTSVWSWATYEITEGGVIVDVLLMSNADDGMIMIIPPDRPTNWTDLLDQTWTTVGAGTWQDAYSPAWTIRTVDTGDYKFGVIERYAERIWGGAVAGEPDMLVYSAPYNPTDWEADPDIPEDGAGAIKQPSWDGASFTALKAFGNRLLAFKQNRIWSVAGTSPDEYTFYEQYGGGSPYAGTVAVDVERVLMAEKDGMSVYDGQGVSEYARDYVKELWRTINAEAMDQMCAAIWQNKYYLAFPADGSDVNNRLLIYDLKAGTILLYTDIYIESLLSTDYGLYCTTSSTPGKMYQVNYDSWVTGAASGAACRWVSPWMDFGYKRIVKGGFDLYFVPEVQDDDVDITFSIQTEKKTKTKTYTVSALTTAEEAAGKKQKGKRLHFSGTGRRFRVIVEVAEGVTAPWRLLGGLQLVVETDPD